MPPLTSRLALIAPVLLAGCVTLPERVVREHEVQDASAGTMVRVGHTEGVIYRKFVDSWPAGLEDVRHFEFDVTRFAQDVPLDDRPDVRCGVVRHALLQAIETHVRQYVPYTDRAGRRRLHVYFVDRGERRWKETVLVGIDQGLRFFSVEYDVVTRTFGSLHTSGCA